MSELLASDADRERVADRLRTAAGEGRLPYLGVSVLLVVIWALTGMGYFWPVWPIAGWGISFLCPGRLGGRWSRGSSSRACSTGRSPSSLAAGPGSAAPRR